MDNKIHILALPLPLQGHMNPMLQFCKRLVMVSRGTLRVTFVTTSSANNISVPEEGIDSIDIEFIESVTEEIIEASDYVDGFMEMFKVSVTKKLGNFIEKKKMESGYPIKLVLYDSLIPWALDLVKVDLGFPAAAFFTQACFVCAIYNHVHRGTFKVPLEKTMGATTITDNYISLPSMPPLESGDLPSFVYDPITYPTVLDVVLSQNLSLEKADWLLFNTFDMLEIEVIDWLRKFYPIKTIGPTIPSMYLDKTLKKDTNYSLNIFKQNTETSCIQWLNTKEKGSVVYASFGSLSDLKQEQMEEIAWGIINSNFNFLWVVRESEQIKLPKDLTRRLLLLLSGEGEGEGEGEGSNIGKGLVVGWCPQLEVLNHESVGCFVTHCGWNSTLEALSLGVPMVTLPIWIDQTTNAKYIADVWNVGVRVRVGDKGNNDIVVTRKEVEMRIKEVMDGEEEKKNELKKNALKWKELAIEAMSEGGSSYKNIQDFVSSLMSLG